MYEKEMDKYGSLKRQNHLQQQLQQYQQQLQLHQLTPDQIQPQMQSPQ